jgi:hypothetical protein
MAALFSELTRLSKYEINTRSTLNVSIAVHSTSGRRGWETKSRGLCGLSWA